MYDILVKVGADVTQFSKNMKGISKDLGSISNNANKITLGKLVGAIGITAAVAKGFNMVKNSVGGAVDRLDTLNNFPRVMERVGFSVEESQKSINKLSDGIDGLPTTLDDVAGTAQRIAIMTKDLDGAVDTTLALNNAFLASGSNSADAARGLEQYVQMLSKGGVDLQSWRTLQETMGVALNDVAESFGFAGASAQNDLYDALKKGKITFDDFNGRIVEMSNKTGGFADIARDASGGIKTAWTNVQTAITRGVANVIKAFDDFLGTTSLGSIEQIFIRLKGTISDFFNNVAQNVPVIINKFREFYELISPFLPLITRIATGVGIFVTALAGLNSIISIVSSVIGFLGTNLGILGAVFSFIISPIGLTILAIAGLVAAFVIAYQKVEWFRDFVDEAWAKIKEYFDVALKFIIDISKKVMSDVADFFKEILGKITAFWNDHGELILKTVKLYFDSVWQYIKAVMGFIKGMFEVVWPIISGVVKIAWNYIKLWVRNGIDLIHGIVNTVMALLKGDWEGAWNSIKETADKIWKNIVKFFEDVDLYQIGADIIQGLINGIGSMGNAVWTAAKKIASNVKESIMSFLGIHSPSRVMRDQVGVHIGTGVAAGITKSTGTVTKAAKAQAAAAKKASSEAIKNLEVKFDTNKIGASRYIAELKKIQAQYKLTGDQARKVQRELYQAGKLQAKQAEQLKTSLSKINDGVKAADNKHLDKIKSINAKLKTDIKKINDNFKKELAGLASSIYNQVGLFDEVKSEKVSGGDLLKNLKAQNSQFKVFNADLDKIQSAGVSKKFVDELRVMGVNASDEINAIANMPKSELNAYVKAWKEKHALANAEADAQMTKAKENAQKQIKDLTAAANTELSKAKTVWIENIRKLGSEVKKLGDFKNSGKVLGKNVIDGLVKGLTTMKGPLADAAKELAKSIEATIKATLKIKSPSRVMVALAKFVPAGLAKGIDANIGSVRNAAVRLSEAMTPEAPTVSMAYATPDGVSSSLASAINGTVDVGNSRDDRIADAIDDLRRDMTNLRVEIDRREIGRVVSDVSTEARDSAVRSGGRRRING